MIDLIHLDLRNNTIRRFPHHFVSIQEREVISVVVIMQAFDPIQKVTIPFRVAVAHAAS